MYTIPTNKDKKLDKEVLVINKTGWPKLRNSEPLYKEINKFKDYFEDVKIVLHSCFSTIHILELQILYMY